MKIVIKHLFPIPVIEHDGRLYIQHGEFFTMLAEKENVPMRTLREDNFKRSNAGNFIMQNGVSYCPIVPIISFCNSNAGKYRTCKDICTELDTLLVFKEKVTCMNSKNTRSIKEIYEDVAKFNFGRGSEHLSTLLRGFDEGRTIPTLYDIHRTYFDKHEWEKIAFFEWHFHLHCSAKDEDIDHDDQVKQRESFLETLYKANSMSEIIVQLSQKTLTKKQT